MSRTATPRAGPPLDRAKEGKAESAAAENRILSSTRPVGSVTAGPWHHAAITEVFELLEVQPALGLSERDVARRLHEFGPNRVTARRHTPAWLKFLQQFNQPLVYILLVASTVTWFLGEWVDSSVIFGVVFVNAIFGYLQETKAEKAIEALANMVASQTTVRRNGTKKIVNAETVVPGDVVLLQAGDRVPADLRIFSARGFRVDESALTGESLPVSKHVDALAADTLLADRKNLAFASTLVTSGEAEGVVWATGDQTETGKIARLIHTSVDVSTPLTKKIQQFSKLLLWAILGIAVLTFAIGVARGEKSIDMFMAAVALAVGAIPEGLPAAVTIVLAIGVARMARRQAVIRHLPAVEALGSTTVICSDKTGTLTENQMTVRQIYAGGRLYTFTGNGYEPVGEVQCDGQTVQLTKHVALHECLVGGLLCNDSQVTRDADGRVQIQGDPTEGAMLVAAEKAGISHAQTLLDAPRMDMIPFESEQMFRATLHHRKSHRTIYKAGAVERLFERCSDMLGADGQLLAVDKQSVHRAVEEMAAAGLRVIAIARRHVDAQHARLEPHHVTEGLTFIGLQGMIDPPRTEAIASVAKCQRAGITVKMITGDHAVTAEAIARQIGLLNNLPKTEHPVITGRQLEKFSDEELPEIAEKLSVFARVAPEQKLRLVKALQARNHIVAMTGDGVNDAPALKQADIGVAMGITGTEVAKGAADMVLTDDNFASIEAAVEEGRGVFDNLTKFIVWTLPTNAGEAMLLISAIIFGTLLPALPVQLLWVNMTTAIFLGLTLVFEPKEQDLMLRPPRDPRRPLLTHALIMRTGLVSLIMMAGAFWLFYWELHAETATLPAARTAVVNVIVLVEVAYLFNCRSLNHSVARIGFSTNRWVLGGAAAMIAVQLLFTYAPIMNKLFQTAPVRLDSWVRIFIVAAAAFCAVELEKWIRFGGKRGEKALPE